MKMLILELNKAKSFPFHVSKSVGQIQREIFSLKLVINKNRLLLYRYEEISGLLTRAQLLYLLLDRLKMLPEQNVEKIWHT